MWPISAMRTRDLSSQYQRGVESLGDDAQGLGMEGKTPQSNADHSVVRHEFARRPTRPVVSPNTPWLAQGSGGGVSANERRSESVIGRDARHPTGRHMPLCAHLSARQGVTTMSKAKDTKKDSKKPAAKSLKEKRAEKKAKKSGVKAT
jgi:hypothetical protein